MIEKIPFGDTGHESTRVIFGAAALFRASQDEADRLLEPLFEHGVNHIDTAAAYGKSEERLGPWMERYRKRFFLATKTGERRYAEARESIERSLERLRTDQVDLIQFHNLVAQEDWEAVLGAGGALEAALEAREQGLVRFIGVTGHGWSVAGMHLRSLERFPFDSVLLPYNYTMMAQPPYAADFEALYSTCQERGVAMQTIKSIARRRWKGERGASWYEPLRDRDALKRGVHWVLSRPGVFLNTSMDAAVLPEILEAAAETTTQPSEAQMQADVARLEMEPLFGPGVDAI